MKTAKATGPEDILFALEIGKLRSSKDSWMEISNLVAKFHRSKQEKFGKSNGGRYCNVWSLKDTGKLLLLSTASISTYIMLADFMEANPTFNFKEMKIATAIEEARKWNNKGRQSSNT